MKFIALTAFILFMILSVYVLLTGKIPSSTPKNFKATSTSHVIGEKPNRDLLPFELQRQRIESTSVITFKNAETSETYELDEDELQEFSSQLKNMKYINQREPDAAIDIYKSQKEYYEVD